MRGTGPKEVIDAFGYPRVKGDDFGIDRTGGNNFLQGFQYWTVAGISVSACRVGRVGNMELVRVGNYKIRE